MNKELIAEFLEDYEESAQHLADMVSCILWEGRQVRVTKGNGSWVGRVTTTARPQSPLVSIVQHNRTKKYHRIHFNDLELED